MSASGMVGFVGTGIMGAPMVRNLRRAGYGVRAWNRSRDKAETLSGDGITRVDAPSAVATGAEVVICMLSSGPVCDEILLGPDGVVAAMAPGSTLVVMSSIPVETARRQAEAAAAAGVGYVDAP
ncbi:NAD(P)-dependent oxidoreductase, partial [Methylobacterium trifolii]